MTARSIRSFPVAKVFSSQTVFFVHSLLLKKISSSYLNKLVIVGGGAGATFDESGHSEVWGVQGGVLWRLGFPMMSRRIARRVFSLIRAVLNERLTVVRGNFL